MQVAQHFPDPSDARYVPGDRDPRVAISTGGANAYSIGDSFSAGGLRFTTPHLGDCCDSPRETHNDRGEPTFYATTGRLRQPLSSL